MRVRIDEPWKHNSPLNIKDFTLDRDLVSAPDCRDSPFANHHRPITDDRQFGKLGTNARTFWPGQRDKLRYVNKGKRAHPSVVAAVYDRRKLFGERLATVTDRRYRKGEADRISAQFVLDNLVNFFETPVRIRADLSNFFDKRRFEFLVLQLTEIDLHV